MRNTHAFDFGWNRGMLLGGLVLSRHRFVSAVELAAVRGIFFSLFFSLFSRVTQRTVLQQYITGQLVSCQSVVPSCDSLGPWLRVQVDFQV